MPFVNIDGVRLYWRADGRGDRPALLLGNSLGTDHALWDAIMPNLIERFRVIRYDMRGHGASDAPAGEYTIERLGRDALAVADAAGAKQFSWAGVSLGGMVGMWLGTNAPERVTRLVLSNTGAKLDASGWAARIELVKKQGMGGLVDAVMQRFFTARYVERGDARFATVRSTFLTLDGGGYIGCCAAIRDMDQSASIKRITAPTLVITGSEDQATPAALGEAVAAAIPGARVASLPVAHIPHLEAPRQFCDVAMSFLLGLDAPISEQQRYEMGLERRKEVLGRKYVEERLRQVNSFNTEFQNFITRYAWGELWTRTAFDDRTRRLLVLGMTAALGRWEEFRLHIRAGLEAELTTQDIKELLMEASIYCGVPVGNTGFHHAQEFLPKPALPE
ncbi:MAG TPA: 3-oxoadipate enol-lactonase [Burkholderiales bacterium]